MCCRWLIDNLAIRAGNEKDTSEEADTVQYFSSVLQCVAVCCSLLQCVLQCVAVCCSVLQCVAVCCSVLQYVAVCCSVVQRVANEERASLGHDPLIFLDC